MTETEMDILIGAYDENNELSKSDYEKFIRNPEEFFENVFEVIYIADNDNFNKNYAGQKFPNYYNCNNDINISFDNNNRKIINHNQEIRIGNSEYYWVLRAFCNPICLKSLNFIRNNVNSNFDDISITVNRRNKKIYQQEIKDHNLSSMCLYSGPCHNIKGEGLMHTGDAKLLRDDVYNNFRIHYHNYLENICIAQIPHHGSKRDSNFDTFSIFPNLKLLYATKQEKTNGKIYPHLSPDYIGKDFIKEVTEKPKTVLAFENIDALDHIFYIDKTIFEKLSLNNDIDFNDNFDNLIGMLKFEYIGLRTHASEILNFDNRFITCSPRKPRMLTENKLIFLTLLDEIKRKDGPKIIGRARTRGYQEGNEPPLK